MSEVYGYGGWRYPQTVFVWEKLQRVIDANNPQPENPVSLADMKLHLRETEQDFDTEIEEITGAATAMIEGPDGAGIALQQDQWDYFLGAFPPVIDIVLGPLVSVDEIEYTDADGVLQIVDPADYEVDLVLGRIRTVENADWPETDDVYNPVRVRFTAGYPAGGIPRNLKQAVKLITGHWYDNREEVTAAKLNEVPYAAQHIIEQYRRGRFG